VAARRARILRGQQAGDHPQALRRHLIAVTQRLLVAHGLTGLTTRAIAREAQVSDGVLYNHFADKDDLVVAALADQVARLSTEVHARCPVAGAQDLRAGLTQLVQLCQDFLGQALPVIGSLASRPELLPALLDRIHTAEAPPQLLWGEICVFVQAEQALGTADPDVDPHTVAEVIFGACQLRALAELFIRHSEFVPPVPAAERATDLDRLVTFLLRACAA
jgi:AcrR family transcriptional regulator